MGDGGIDILVITLNRTEYTRLSLSKLFETCDDRMRVWIWQNGTHEATVDLVRSYENHPNCYKVHFSAENIGQRIPTEWLWTQAKGDYLSKVDDDCLVPADWAKVLRRAHEDYEGFGAIGTWAFPPEDFQPDLANKKIRSFPGGHRLMINCWIGGSGYLLKKGIVDRFGFWHRRESFTGYCKKLAYLGYINGWYFPFMYLDHMDHPLSEHTILKTEEAFQKFKPASAYNFGINTLEGWRDRQRFSAEELQKATTEPKDHLKLVDRLRIIWEGMRANYQSPRG